MESITEELIPIEKVLDDMYSDSFIASSARDYYYSHYATDKEKAEMDFEDKIQNAVCCLFAVLIIAGLVVGVVYG